METVGVKLVLTVSLNYLLPDLEVLQAEAANHVISAIIQVVPYIGHNSSVYELFDFNFEVQPWERVSRLWVVVAPAIVHQKGLESWAQKH